MTFEAYKKQRPSARRSGYGGMSHAQRIDRFVAAAKLWNLAEEWGVKPTSIGQFATATGSYRTDPTILRRDRTFPLRFSPEGERLAELVYQACAPWNPHYLGERADRILSEGIS